MRREIKHKLEHNGTFLGYFTTTPQAAQLAIEAGITPEEAKHLVFSSVSTFTAPGVNMIVSAVAEATAEKAEAKAKTPARRGRKKKVETEETKAE